MIVLLRRLWQVLVTLTLVLVCMIAGAAIRSAADAPAPSHLQVSMPGDGGRFSDEPTGPLLDFHRLAPGSAIAGVMGVRSLSAGIADLSIQMVHLREIEHCTATGPSCRSGQFTSMLRFALSVAPSRHGWYRHVWSGSAGALSRAVEAAHGVPDRGVRWLRLSAQLAANAGNNAQLGALEFGLRVQLDAGLLGTTATTLGAVHPPGGLRIAGLAVTGVQLDLITAFALALLAVGGCVSFLGRRKRSEAPGTG